ncbi:TIGR00725 family protein [Vreelandella sulfidaeris]|uniref:TIGR00725 family protein n=1 Tax=Vreelandella sulfidaeris TaxID=115553 RepID=UPI0035EFC430
MTNTLQIYLDEYQRITTQAGETLLPKMRPLGEAGWPTVLQNPCPPRDALIALKLSNTPMQRPPVGVIGPREATQRQLEIAYALGAGLAELGIPLLCGGRGGVMEAASKGAALKGGVVIGLLPDTHSEAANPWVTLPIASGLGEARNVLIARASVMLIAVGGSLGTHTEVSFGRHFNKPVLTFPDAPNAEGVTPVSSVEEALTLTAAHLWGVEQ